MNKKTIYLGVIVITALTILLIVSIYMNEIRFSVNQKKVHVKFSSINGLKVDDEVRIRGVKCGQVKSIELHEDFVLVTLNVSKSTDIAANSIAGIHDFAFIGGTKYIMLYPGNSKEPYQLPDTLNGENYDFSMAKISILLQDIRIMLEKSIPEPEIVQGMIDSLNLILSNANKLIETGNTELIGISGNLEASSYRLKSLLDTTYIALNIVKNQVDQFRENDNSLKSFMESDTLYRKFERSIDRLDRMLKSVENNPVGRGCL